MRDKEQTAREGLEYMRNREQFLKDKEQPAPNKGIIVTIEYF